MSIEAGEELVVRVTLIRSLIGEKPKTRGTANALGLRRPGHQRTHVLSPPLEGMLRRVRHLVEVHYVGEVRRATPAVSIQTAGDYSTTNGEGRIVPVETQAIRDGQTVPVEKRAIRVERRDGVLVIGWQSEASLKDTLSAMYRAGGSGDHWRLIKNGEVLERAWTEAPPTDNSQAATNVQLARLDTSNATLVLERFPDSGPSGELVALVNDAGWSPLRQVVLDTAPAAIWNAIAQETGLK